MKKAILTAGEVVLNLELNETPLADKIYQALPLEGKADHWGEECHFAVDLDVGVEAEHQTIVQIGDVLFLPTDKVIALGFGPTLWSEDEEIRYEHTANVWATCKDDVAQLIFVPNDAIIKITAV